MSSRIRKNTTRRRERDRPQLPAKGVACNSCSKKKAKCVGFPPDPCEACQKANSPCSWRQLGKKKLVLEEEFEALKERCRQLENQDAFFRAKMSVPTYEEPEIEDVDKDDNLLRLETMTVNRRFVGHGAAVFLVKQLANSSQNLSWDLTPLHDDMSWPRKQPQLTCLQLPPVAFARKLFERQHAYIGRIFSFVQPTHFEARMVRFYQGPPDTTSQESCLEYCQLLLTLAFGQLYYQNSASPEVPGYTYFRHALQYLPEFHELPSVLFVEVLSLAGYYLQVLNRRDAAFLYIGVALRMAIRLGLHQETDDIGLDIVQREHRRRVWWSVYSMDRIICVKSGNPIAIDDDDVGVEWPSYLQDLDGKSSVARVLTHYSMLSRLLGKIGEGVYRTKHPSNKTLLRTILSLLQDLSAWLDELPHELRIDPKNIDTTLSREAVSTLSHYYQCINMTVRPLLFSVTQKRLKARSLGPVSSSWKDELPPSIVKVIDHAIMTARLSAEINSAAARQNWVATYGYMDGEHAFSAALVLVMVNMAFEYDEQNRLAMETALSVLKVMADNGNRYAAQRHQVLTDLTIWREDKVQNQQSNTVYRGPPVQPEYTTDAFAPAVHVPNDTNMVTDYYYLPPYFGDQDQAMLPDYMMDGDFIMDESSMIQLTQQMHSQRQS